MRFLRLSPILRVDLRAPSMPAQPKAWLGGGVLCESHFLCSVLPNLYDILTPIRVTPECFETCTHTFVLTSDHLPYLPLRQARSYG